MKCKNLIVDANFFIALALPNDSFHKKAEKYFNEMSQNNVALYINNYILAEIYTVTTLKSKKIETALFLEVFFAKASLNTHTIHFKKSWDNLVKRFFLSQERYKGGFSSYSDCSLIIQARKHKIKNIFTFDEGFKQFSDEFDLIGV